MTHIHVNNVTVDYPVAQDKSLSLRRVLVNLGTGGKIFRNERGYSIVRALNNISFSLQAGDRLGLVGMNGAGKTTLLRVIGQFLRPTQGTLDIAGKVSTLFDVCVGMDLERTGYDNIFYMGRILGMKPAEIRAHLDELIEFTALGDFLSVPVRTYSQGMRVRLGFAISTCLRPDILLLDEAIGAGDRAFIDKAALRAKQLYDSAKIFILASHSNAILREFCNRIIWMNKGQIVMDGPTEEVLHAYEA